MSELNREISKQDFNTIINSFKVQAKGKHKTKSIPLSRAYTKFGCHKYVDVFSLFHLLLDQIETELRTHLLSSN